VLPGHENGNQDRARDLHPQYHGDPALGEEDRQIPERFQAFDEIDFGRGSENEADDERRDLQTQLDADPAEYAEDEQGPDVEHDAVIDGVGADDAHHQDDGIEDGLGNGHGQREPANGVIHGHEGHDIGQHHGKNH